MRGLRGEESNFYKSSSRYDIPSLTYSETVFEEYIMSTHSTESGLYEAWEDSEVFAKYVHNFGDSDGEFKSIPYDKIDQDLGGGVINNSLMYHTNLRKREHLIMKYRDWAQAMKLNGSLSYSVYSTKTTYNDYAAYETKWNTINANRTVNTEGWMHPDYARQWIGYKNERRVDFRAKALGDDIHFRYPEYNTVKSSEIAYDHLFLDNHLWYENYQSNKINTIPDRHKEVDLKTYMKSRRKDLRNN